MLWIRSVHLISKYLELSGNKDVFNFDLELNLMTNKQQNRKRERRVEAKESLENGEWRIIVENSQGRFVEQKVDRQRWLEGKKKGQKEGSVILLLYFYSLWSPFRLSTFPFLESVNILFISISSVVVAWEAGRICPAKTIDA